MVKLPFINSIKFVDKLLFTKHLSIMLKSGIPLAEAISILTDQSRNAAFKKILLGIARDIANGQSLEKSLSRYPDVFDPLYRSIIAVGEEAGNLESNSEYLAATLQKTYEFRKKVQGAMMYPMLILVVAGLVGGGIVFFILPQLSALFKSLDVTLPLSTRILLWIADLAKNYGLIIIIVLLLSVSLFIRLISTARLKPHWHRFLLGVPVYGQFLQNSEMANFCRNMGMMLKSGLPIARALKVAREATYNLVFRSYVTDLVAAVDRGQTIEKTWSGAEKKYIPVIVPRMIGVGEKTGRLDESLLYLADFFEGEVDDMAKNLSSILEPAMLLVVAGFVAFLAFSIISPIYQFTGSVHR